MSLSRAWIEARAWTTYVFTHGFIYFSACPTMNVMKLQQAKCIQAIVCLSMFGRGDEVEMSLFRVVEFEKQESRQRRFLRHSIRQQEYPDGATSTATDMSRMALTTKWEDKGVLGLSNKECTHKVLRGRTCRVWH